MQKITTEEATTPISRPASASVVLSVLHYRFSSHVPSSHICQQWRIFLHSVMFYSTWTAETIILLTRNLNTQQLPSCKSVGSNLRCNKLKQSLSTRGWDFHSPLHMLMLLRHTAATVVLLMAGDGCQSRRRDGFCATFFKTPVRHTSATVTSFNPPSCTHPLQPSLPRSHRDQREIGSSESVILYSALEICGAQRERERERERERWVEGVLL